MKRIKSEVVREDPIVRSTDVANKTKTTPGKLRQKEYSASNSLLTELYQNKHIATVYHLFLVILFGLFINTAVYDYVYKGEIKLGFNLIFKGFANLHLAILIWLGMFVASFACYYGFKFWATIRIGLTPKLKLIWDTSMMLAVVGYYYAFMHFSVWAIILLEIPIAASLTLLCDNVRFLMVFHSFIRTNAPKVLVYKPNCQKRLCPELSKFLYFSFAPTLIYQDEYPRSETIRWKNFLMHVLEFFGGVFFMSFIFETFLMNSFHEYGLRHYSWQELLMIFVKNTAGGMLLVFNVFYVILHTWMNGFAELLRFSDRNFYEDWWTSTSYARYYKTWNVVVHDWLFTYIYKDFYEHVYSRSKVPARMAVFLISAIYHEYVLAFAFRFCLPILFIEFIFVGVPIMFVKTDVQWLGNTVFLYALGLGTGIVITAYAMEHFARVNCPVEDETLLSYFIPQLFFCNK